MACVLSRGEGSPCSFNVQCDDGEGLTCRPTEVGGDDNTCQPIGGNGDACDNRFDCAGERPCIAGHCEVKKTGGGW
jgi:hypothetical protein